LAEFEKAWSRKSEKTAFYGSFLLPKVAKRLGYERQSEFLTCDFAFVNSDGVPMVFIESENAHGTALHEIDGSSTFSVEYHVTLRGVAFGYANPNGIAAFGPGLRGTSYPG
jgi:hypothetical protein